MSTFIGQLIGFAVIVAIIWRYVVPPLKNMMANQKEAVRTQLDDSAKAGKRLADADKHHAKRVDEAKAEAKRIVEEARVDAEGITAQLRAQADVEVERIKVQGAQQVQLLRAQLIRQLRQDLGSESVRRAGELVRAHVADSQSQSATVDRFLDELDSMAPAAYTPEARSDLRSASRDAQAAVSRSSMRCPRICRPMRCPRYPMTLRRWPGCCSQNPSSPAISRSRPVRSTPRSS